MHSEDITAEGIDLILPVLPVRDAVLFPGVVKTLYVSRERSITAVESAICVDKKFFLVCQKDPSIDNPEQNDLYQTGVIATILQVLRLPTGMNILVEAEHRANIKGFRPSSDMLRASIEVFTPKELNEADPKQEKLMRKLIKNFENYINKNDKVPAELLKELTGINDVLRLIDIIAHHLDLTISEYQQLLSAKTVEQAVAKVSDFLLLEQQRKEVTHTVEKRVKKQIDKNQREYILNEQLKAVQKELQDVAGEQDDFTDFEQKIKQAKMTKEAETKALHELKKLKMISPMSPESGVLRNYLDWMVKLPWKKQSKIKYDINNAEKILDQHHYGLHETKQRILEYLAVLKRVKKHTSPILCLVGPPGVGKTSLAKSIAEATDRHYVRFALGGVRDEAEIRGHRRTYVGSMPGKIIQNIVKSKVNNPLFLLDEIDKIAMDYRGDPAAALLEVLDPEQNQFFNDHYIEVDYDLSKVLFIATANTMDIPPALRDRMEIIRLSGYTEQEKLHIAKQHLMPKQLTEHGLSAAECYISDNVLLAIIRLYTREAGVRSLEREIAKICRKTVKRLSVEKNLKTVRVTNQNIANYLGVAKYRYQSAEEQDQVGQVTGMAWTEVGGDLLTIEAAVVSGKGDITSTGSLGKVMQESIKAAVTVVRARAEQLGLANDFYKTNDIHVHVPEGATPKDGPSAGTGMCTALISALTNIPARHDVAMTGEITLRGEVLPIGGLKEKLLAAKRGGIKTVIVPEQNKREIADLDKSILNDLDIKFVKWIDEVIMLALQQMPKPKKSSIADKISMVVPEASEALGCHLTN